MEGRVITVPEKVYKLDDDSNIAEQIHQEDDHGGTSDHSA